MSKFYNIMIFTIVTVILFTDVNKHINRIVLQLYIVYVGKIPKFYFMIYRKLIQL